MELTFDIPKHQNPAEHHTLNIVTGSVVFLLGANGSGKSALVTHINKSCRGMAVVRIAAHRQSWLASSSIDLTQSGRNNIYEKIQRRDRQDDARWKDDHAVERAQMALFDLANAENTIARLIASLVREGDSEGAVKKAQDPSPIEAMNEVLNFSTLSVKLSISEEGVIKAQHGEGPEFNINKLSDGERNAVMLAAQVLTAKPDTLFIIDEPERHLHRAITEPLLTSLFERRGDCSFVIATHEPELPSCNTDAQIVLVRGCTWNGDIASGWDIDFLTPDTEIPESVKKSILGSRRNLLFIEGEIESLDYPMYSALFPNISVVSRGSCSEVIRAVKGLKETDGVHWLNPIGLIDSDDRTPEEVNGLKKQAIYALSVNAVEGLFYSLSSIEKMADLQAGILGLEARELIEEAINNVLTTLDEETQKSLAARRCERTARNYAMKLLPDWKIIKDNNGASMEFSIETTYEAELKLLKKAIEENDIDAIVSRFPIKKTGLPAAISNSLKFQNKRNYEEAVVVQVRNNEEFRNVIKSKLGELS